ncbi:MAG: hypothetical protein PHR30_16575 [Gallionellaceae bacterium]|nr:hypothetical protein [Gallionellaceae bacterium]
MKRFSWFWLLVIALGIGLLLGSLASTYWLPTQPRVVQVSGE